MTCAPLSLREAAGSAQERRLPAFETRSRDSVLFVTLDSCRYDTFVAAAAPNMKAIAPLHRAQAPSYYTYGSHSAMFVGFTPGLAHVAEPILNPKFGKLFKLVGGGFVGKGTEAYELQGRNIVEGFRNRGFATVGSGAVGWFDTSLPTGRHLTESFDQFMFAGSTSGLDRQLDWLSERLAETRGDVFTFLNVGETHVPYYFKGAPWPEADNPCLPFQNVDRSEDCRTRQRLCCEFADAALAPLLAAFKDSTILICGDHGDCWGEDGLWEHGISHPVTLTVPLMVRHRGEPVATRAPEPAAAEPKGRGLFGWLRGATRA
jgi:hypothetical protein